MTRSKNMGQPLERKLVAIMFTDIVGYSKMMSNNETRAFALLAEHNSILEVWFQKYNGRILKKIGDSFLTEFSSAFDALSCAVEIQNDLKKYNESRIEEKKILIRIGIHLGDVIVQDDDIFGEGVNVAFRLEQLADPGGVCLSSAVYESARSFKMFNMIKQGEVELKNILEKYLIYKVPSVYGDKYQGRDLSFLRGSSLYDFKIKQIISLPVRFLSPIEVAVYSVTAIIAVGAAMEYAVAYQYNLSEEEMRGFLDLFDFSPSSSFLLTICVSSVLFLVYTLASKSVRILFSDVRDPDKLMEMLTTHIGYKQPVKKGDQIIFKPSLYLVLTWGARNIKVNIDGSSVTLFGNYMMINKLLRTMKGFEKR